MQKLRYPLVVSDFDGTLARKDGTIGEKTKRVIEQFIADGGTFCVCTGRMPSAILPVVRNLGLKGLVSCGQGSVIMDIESGKTLMEGRLPHDLSVEICKKVESLGLHTHTYDLFDYYTNVEDEALRLYEEAVKIKAKRILDKPLWKFIEETGLQPFKFLMMVKPEDNDMFIKKLEEMRFENCVVTKSANFLIEICNVQYSKATALEFLANWKNISIENTIAIGDQWNDMPMLKRAGLGLAVANAQKELKEIATALPFTNNEDAVAYAIENYAYSKEE